MLKNLDTLTPIIGHKLYMVNSDMSDRPPHHQDRLLEIAIVSPPPRQPP